MLSVAGSVNTAVDGKAARGEGGARQRAGSLRGGAWVK
jgi:hypothetical protein